MNLEQLREFVQSVEPAAQLVEPRILRRVIRLDRRLPGFGLSALRRQSYAIERDRLLAFVELSELDLPSAIDLPRVVILLARPDSDELENRNALISVLQRYQRLLFHTNVEVLLEDRIAEQPSPSVWIEERRLRIGDAEFAEIRNVLVKDDFLFPSPSDHEVYCKFAAVYLELRYFAPQELPSYFPGIRDWSDTAEMVGHDVDHAALFQALKFPILSPESEANGSIAVTTAAKSYTDLPYASEVTLAEFRRMQAKAERFAALGNSVRSAIEHARAARVAPAGYGEEAFAAAQQEISRLALRLQAVLQLADDEGSQWAELLQPLLVPAASGFWSNEARLLYDVQKVCIEHERGVYRLDVIEWIRTWGKRPIRRPLPLLRDALVIRHLRTAHRRVAAAPMASVDRDRLTDLLELAVRRIEYLSRDRLRPVLIRVLDAVGLVPQNLPERVSRSKLVEELLDRVVEHSYLTMADLRDALSKNELKLPDVLSLSDLWNGDRLLRADKRLDAVLDGIYRRGAVYQRWPQSLSSIAFGTRFGRFLTQHLAIPFGGAYLALEFLLHVEHKISHTLWPPPAHVQETLEHAAQAEPTMHEDSAFLFYAAVALLGTWVSFMLHKPAFRAWNLAVLQHAWHGLKLLCYDLPARVYHSNVVQKVLNSRAYATLHNYAFRPAFVTGILYALLFALGKRWSNRGIFELFLIVSLGLNSSLGRYVTEMIADIMVRAWHELRIRVFGAVLQWIVDVFHGLIVALERMVYTVDEWLRFRAGDSRAMQAVKAIGGIVWFFVAYAIVFVFTLLVEPQINPLKHFPVVTVSHKLILPTMPIFIGPLTPYLGKAWANTVVVTASLLIPGVFGFLVWELKENWRLYAANRRKTLRPIPIGSHGETMIRLLRPGFHSGTLPRAFAALRRALRRNEAGRDTNLLAKRQAAIHHVERDVQRFVDREFVALLAEAALTKDRRISIGEVHAATNRIEVEVRLVHAEEQEAPLRLMWEDDAGKIIGIVSQVGWIERMPLEEREVVVSALAGLFQRSGVEEVRGALRESALTPIAWRQWVAYWSLPSGEPLHESPRTLPATSLST